MKKPTKVNFYTKDGKPVHFKAFDTGNSKSSEEKSQECLGLVEQAHVIFNADTEYDARKLFREAIKEAEERGYQKGMTEGFLDFEKEYKDLDSVKAEWLEEIKKRLPEEKEPTNSGTGNIAWYNRYRQEVLDILKSLNINK